MTGDWLMSKFNNINICVHFLVVANAVGSKLRIGVVTLPSHQNKPPTAICRSHRMFLQIHIVAPANTYPQHVSNYVIS